MIDANKFYQYGVICFSIIAVCSLINFFIFFNSYNLFSAIASAAQVLFNFILAAFFWYLYKNQNLMTGAAPGDSSTDEINEALKEVVNGKPKRRSTNRTQ
jgi:hypothetical protein